MRSLESQALLSMQSDLKKERGERERERETYVYPRTDRGVISDPK